MSKFTFLSLLIFLSVTLRSQTIILQAGGGYSSHNANIDKKELNNSSEVPSIGMFFDDGGMLSASLLFAFKNLKTGSESIVFGISYENQSMGPSDNEIVLLGHDLDINSLGASIEYWFRLSKKIPSLFMSIDAGYLFKYYKGTGTADNNYQLESTYGNANAVRVGAGFTFFSYNVIPLSFGVHVSYETGTVERKDINVSRNGISVGRLVPIGDTVLPDNVFTIKFNFSYPFFF